MSKEFLLSLDHVFSVIRYSKFCGSLFNFVKLHKVSGVRG
ncbi:hypothetical protein D1BOALGB6SA_10557 [Olavius sp. associated proteobacterium Delta 1]|nr:hypothetical protein D1BOALGB6SA_10557 [Olavius sp. associated proteobacterium Delta 1]